MEDETENKIPKKDKAHDRNELHGRKLRRRCFGRTETDGEA
jgi:hypothetical protein